MEKIKIGILGYGNLGRGVECAVKQSGDMEVKAVFTRRDPGTLSILTPGAAVYSSSELESMREAIDVLIICGGSATDLPVLTPKYARLFNVVDSFDNHSRIPEHFAAVDAAAKAGGKTAAISIGWDPGLFSLNRALASSVLARGENYTFWGKGVSQGHSDAIRRIEGVLDARQYTVPVEEALERVRAGENPKLTARQKHTRECYVAAREGADRERIRQEIVSMPAYFADYDTTVHFISREELQREHGGIPHGGFMIRTGKTGWEETNSHVIEYKLKLDSNPEFTSSVLTAYARAVWRMAQEKLTGCKTILDIPISYTSPISHEELLRTML